MNIVLEKINFQRGGIKKTMSVGKYESPEKMMDWAVNKLNDAGFKTEWVNVVGNQDKIEGGFSIIFKDHKGYYPYIEFIAPNTPAAEQWPKDIGWLAAFKSKDSDPGVADEINYGSLEEIIPELISFYHPNIEKDIKNMKSRIQNLYKMKKYISENS